MHNVFPFDGENCEREKNMIGTDGVSRRSVLRAGVLASLLGVAATGGAMALDDGTARASSSGRSGAPPRPTAPPVQARPAPTTIPHATPRPAGASPRHPAVTPDARGPLWAGTWDTAIDHLDGDLARRLHTSFDRRAIMLTIDDGPNPEWTPRYLRLLEKYGVTATFCVIGEQVAGNAHLLKAAVGDGHHIANHTFHHPLTLPSLSTRAIRREMVDTTDAVVRASGFRPRQFRAPGGVWGPAVFAEAARQEMMPLGWDIDPRDWSLPGVPAIRDAMLAARPHDIVLCHDGGGDRSQTYAALTTVIPALLHRGYRFVTLPAPH